MKLLPFLKTKKISEIIWYALQTKRIQNWNILVADLLGLLNGAYTLNLADAEKRIKLEAKNNHPWIILEVILKDDYQLNLLKNYPPSTIIDLGAHIGIFSIWAKILYPQTQIYSLEPNAYYFNLLRENIQLNHSLDQIHASQSACVGESSNRHFPIRATFPSVPTISLTQILKKNNIKICNFLKIDIEGSEYEVLYTTPSEILSKIQRISLEYHDLKEGGDLNGIGMKNFMEKNGYQVTIKRSGRNIGHIFATR